MTKTHIMLASGTLFDILDPESSDFTLQDIAQGLGNMCRFAGQSSRFYSVAEHCTHVARLVPIALGRAALLHDATEAFIGDVTRPLKALLPDYRAIEEKIAGAIARRFLADMGGDIDGAIFHRPEIKAADMAICMIEARNLMPEIIYPEGGGYWIDAKTEVKALYPAAWEHAKGVRLKCDKPEFATAAFLRAWHHYGHRQAQIRQDESGRVVAGADSLNATTSTETK